MLRSFLRRLAATAALLAATGLLSVAAHAGAPGMKDRYYKHHRAYKHHRHERWRDPHYSVKHWRHRHYGDPYPRRYDPYAKYPDKPYAYRYKYWHYKRPYPRRGAYAWISYDCYWKHRPLKARVWTGYGWERRIAWRHVRVCPGVPGYVPDSVDGPSRPLK